MSDQRKRLALGQNFLKSFETAQALVRLAHLEKPDRVYDLGAGTGILTRAILATGAQVIAVEKDSNLATRLRQRLTDTRAVVIDGDLADIRFVAPYKVVANIPFNRTALVFRRLFFSAPHPDEAVLVIQREAAEKYANDGRHGVMSLLLRPWFEMRIARAISPSAFVPRPAVEVVALQASKHPAPLLSIAERAAWTAFVRYGFARCRPDARGTFRNLISNLQWRRLSRDLGMDEEARLKDLHFEQWLALYRFVQRYTPVHKLRKLDSIAAEERETQPNRLIRAVSERP